MKKKEEETQHQEKKEMNQSSIDKFRLYLTSKLVNEFGIEGHKKIARAIDKKCDDILRDLTKIYISKGRHSRFPDNDNIKIYTSLAYRKSWGRVTINGKQKWLNTLLGKYMFKEWHKGSDKPSVASAIEFTSPVVLNAISEYLADNMALLDADLLPYFPEAQDEFFATKIDIESLFEFIVEIESQLRSGQYTRDINLKFNPKVSAEQREERTEKYANSKRQRLMANLRYARMIIAAIDDDHVLYQPGSVSDAGRIYLKNINLQQASKEVRHAALGNSYAYDMRCGALGVMAALAHYFCDGAYGFSYIKDYIKRRNDIREQITRDIFTEAMDFEEIKKFGGYYDVKEAFTAIGFGAKKSASGRWQDSSGQWKSSSLNRILGREATDFLQHPLAKKIISEYEMASNIIFAAYKHDQSFYDYLQANSRIDDELSKTQLLAHIYQHFESVILGQLLAGAEKQGATTLLPLHDGAYFDRPIDHISIWSRMRIPFVQDKSFIQFEKKHYESKTHKAFSMMRTQIETAALDEEIRRAEQTVMARRLLEMDAMAA